MDCNMSGLPVHHQLPELAQTHVHWLGDAIQPSHPLSSPSPPVFNFSQHQGLFQSVLHIRWPKYWSFSFSISPSNAYSGLSSFRIDWFGHHVHKAIFKMDNQQEPITENSAQCYTATLDGRGVGYMYMDSWVALLSTWNYHNRLYSSIKEKFF